MKKILLLFLGLCIIPFLTAFITNIIFNKADIQDTWPLLTFDYVLAYLTYPFLYKTKLQKYIHKEFLFFALTFVVLWLIEILVIYTYK